MTTIGRFYRCGRSAAAAMLLMQVAVYAQASPDEPAAVLVYPYVAVDPASGTDTLIQLTNTSDELVELRCFYEDFTPACSSGPSESCFPGAVTCTGNCLPRRTVLPSRLRATPQQPLAWHASSGLQTLPLDGIERIGLMGTSNQFTNVTGVGVGPFVGTFRCVAMTSDPYRPLRDNILVGQATIERSQGGPVAYTDAAQYRAVGIKALAEAPNRDEFLDLGGPDAEYEACPAVGLLDHFFDGAPLRTGDVTADVTTTLVLTNCTVLPSGMTDNVVQFLVFNEFGQRFSTSTVVRGQLVAPLSMIDTSVPQRSIFWYQVSGTLTGRTLMTGSMSGLHIVAMESHRDRSAPSRVQSDAINAHGLSQRQLGDVLAYRPPRCIGDCDFNGTVTVDEILQGVNIGLETLPVDACVPADGNLDSQVTVDEVISSVNAVLNGCPEPVLPPTPLVTPTPTPTAVPPPQSVGPEITHLGVATADDRPLQPDATDVMGRPVFVRPFGQGMTLVVEARRGQSASPVGTSTFSDAGALPDLQVLVSRPLGDGGGAVCEGNGRTGGIPAVPSLDFPADAATAAAINDLGCRAFDSGVPPTNACTRKAPLFGTVSDSSEIQFCIPVAKAWAFPVGDTVVAARVRDKAGNIGPVREIVVRVLE